MGRFCTKRVLSRGGKDAVMRAWRKLVSVIAGTMIAVGGIVGALAVVDVVAPTTESLDGAPPSAWMFDANAAEAAVASDVSEVGRWLNDTVASDGPFDSDTAHDAAVAASALSDVAFGAAAYFDNARGATFEPAADLAEGDGRAGVQDASSIVLSAGGGATGTPPQLEVQLVAQVDEAVTRVLTVGSLYSFGLTSVRAHVVDAAPDVTHTPLANASGAVEVAPTESVALLASAQNLAPEHANWSIAAKDEISARAAAGAIENDTATLALASQALRSTDPAHAKAINAQLRFRQSSDGSFDGDIQATAEAVRALAVGMSQDRDAAARGLDWLDSLGPLGPQDAVARLRAHGFDGALSTLAPAAPEASTGFGPSLVPDGAGAKGVLALLFLGGGIGLSLSLVTHDALKGARRRLYDTIRAQPGLHVNELRRRLRMSPSSIEYHLAVLTGAGLTVSEDDGRYKRYYANGAGLGLNPGSPNSRNTLGALRRPHASEIVQHLMEREDATAREVSRTLGLHESAASRRLAHLERSGLLVSTRVGRERRYRLRDRQVALRALTLVEAPGPAPAEPKDDATQDRGSSEGLPAPVMSP